METAVLVLMIAVCLSFVLKQTFSRCREMIAVAVVCALFMVLTWPYAIQQSRVQIALWLTSPGLMRDTAVVLCVDVALSIWFCILAVRISTAQETVRRRTVWTYRVLRLIPGLMIFPVLFSMLVYAVFSFPGYDFTTVAWCMGVVTGIAIPVCVTAVRWLLPEREIRLELLFLTDILIAMIGIVVTVNGTTAVESTGSPEWSAMAGVAVLAAAGLLTGLFIYRYKLKKINQK